VLKESSLGEVCPACGYKRRVFEPYEDPVSPRRRFLLDLDAHPILVHFPQAFVSILPPLVLLNWVFPDFFGNELAAVIAFCALVLPLLTAGALASGLFDAKLKFKRLSPPLPRRKIAVGGVLLLLSTAGALLVGLQGYHAGTRLYLLLLAGGMLVCAVLLGMMGKRLLPAILRG